MLGDKKYSGEHRRAETCACDVSVPVSRLDMQAFADSNREIHCRGCCLAVGARRAAVLFRTVGCELDGFEVCVMSCCFARRSTGLFSEVLFYDNRIL